MLNVTFRDTYFRTLLPSRLPLPLLLTFLPRISRRDTIPCFCGAMFFLLFLSLVQYFIFCVSNEPGAPLSSPTDILAHTGGQFCWRIVYIDYAWLKKVTPMFFVDRPKKGMQNMDRFRGICGHLKLDMVKKKSVNGSHFSIDICYLDTGFCYISIICKYI
jgi:hypothetical protein